MSTFSTRIGHKNIIPLGLAKGIKGMVRFRNILVHDYLEINQTIVYGVLTKSLKDLDEFARAIVKWLEREG
ncbi:MAG: DUF86 domain-containing protein [Bacillota bacterium]